MTTEENRFHSALENAFQEGYNSFKSCIRFYGLFHVSFISFSCMQLLSFLLFFSYFSKSLMAAFGLALFFLTLFSYFVLLFFFQAKKPQQLLTIRARFCETSQSLLHLSKEDPQALLTVSRALEEFALFLSKKEPSFYASSFTLKAFLPLALKFKIWLHWKDFLQMKQLFFQQSIEIIISLIKKAPTDLELHACLAESYTKLCKLYVHPQKMQMESVLPWISPEYSSSFMHEPFLLYSGKAIEEFKILEDLAPKDPWVLAHLAEIYRLQERAEEEIRHCEELLKLTPDNGELLFQLGVLYFKEGYSAKGLKMYELLQNDSSEKAGKLIQYYN
jgi:tetratricopeptide (TPR) repeat protein